MSKKAKLSNSEALKELKRDLSFRISHHRLDSHVLYVHMLNSIKETSKIIANPSGYSAYELEEAKSINEMLKSNLELVGQVSRLSWKTSTGKRY